MALRALSWTALSAAALCAVLIAVTLVPGMPVLPGLLAVPVVVVGVVSAATVVVLGLHGGGTRSGAGHAAYLFGIAPRWTIATAILGGILFAGTFALVLADRSADGVGIQDGRPVAYHHGAAPTVIDRTEYDRQRQRPRQGVLALAGWFCALPAAVLAGAARRDDD